MEDMRLELKRLRKSTGLNQREFAKKFGIPFWTYQNWESGKRNPASYILKMIDKFLELEKDLDIKFDFSDDE